MAEFVADIGNSGINRQRMPQVLLGFAVLFLLAQYESEADARVDIIGIHRYRAPVASCGVIQLAEFQMFIALLLAGAAFVGRRR